MVVRRLVRCESTEMIWWRWSLQNHALRWIYRRVCSISYTLYAWLYLYIRPQHLMINRILSLRASYTSVFFDNISRPSITLSMWLLKLKFSSLEFRRGRRLDPFVCQYCLFYKHHIGFWLDMRGLLPPLFASSWELRSIFQVCFWHILLRLYFSDLIKIFVFGSISPSWGNLRVLARSNVCSWRLSCFLIGRFSLLILSIDSRPPLLGLHEA